jgi:hypothetical protein
LWPGTGAHGGAPGPSKQKSLGCREAGRGPDARSRRRPRQPEEQKAAAGSTRAEPWRRVTATLAGVAARQGNVATRHPSPLLFPDFCPSHVGLTLADWRLVALALLHEPASRQTSLLSASHGATPPAVPRPPCSGRPFTLTSPRWSLMPRSRALLLCLASSTSPSRTSSAAVFSPTAPGPAAPRRELQRRLRRRPARRPTSASALNGIPVRVEALNS